MDEQKTIIDSLIREIQSLRHENEELKAILMTHGIEYLPKKDNSVLQTKPIPAFR